MFFKKRYYPAPVFSGWDLVQHQLADPMLCVVPRLHPELVGVLLQ